MLLGLLTAGSLIAEEQSTQYYIDIVVDIHSATTYAEVTTWWEDINGYEYDGLTVTHNCSEPYTRRIFLSMSVNPPKTVHASAVSTPYGYYDEDECDAVLNSIHELELWIGVAPDDPTIPQEE